jgi:FkbM family methyltransferase
MSNPKVSIIDCLSGRYMVYSTNDALGKMLLADGVHELPVQQVTEFILKNSNCETVIDIGANIGSYSIPLALKFKNKKFHCFEIQRNIYYQLCGNIFLNSIDNIEAHNIGVSSSEGEISIPKIDYSKCWNIGGYSIDEVALNTTRTDYPNDAIVGHELAKVTTMNNIGKFTNNIALIKLDVEGHELEAMKGALELIHANGYPPIIFESWDFEWFVKSKNELFEFFIQIGYSNISPDIGYSNFLAQSNKSSHSRYLIENNAIQIVSD